MAMKEGKLTIDDVKLLVNLFYDKISYKIGTFYL